MVRIRTNDIFITDDDKIVFGDNFNSEIFWDSSVPYPTTSGDLRLTTTISGVDPTESYHLTTRWYVDTELLDYVPRDGSRGFLSTVSGVDPTEGYHLTTKSYVDNHIPPFQHLLFGLQFHSATAEAEQQTNSVAYEQALRLSISGTTGSGIDPGEYRIGWTFEWRQDRLNYDFRARVQIDDDITIYEFTNSPYVDVLYFALNTGFFYQTAISGGTHYIDLDFATTDSKAVSFIRKSRLEFWRVE